MTTEQPPTVTVRHDLPDHLGVPRRPDGSLAQVTLTVEAETMQLASLGLEKLHEDLTSYSTDWVRSVLTTEQLTELVNSTGEAIPSSVLDASERIHDPFLRLPAVIEFSQLTDSGVSSHSVHVTVTTPSILIAVRSILEMMEPQRRSLMLKDLS